MGECNDQYFSYLGHTAHRFERHEQKLPIWNMRALVADRGSTECYFKFHFELHIDLITLASQLVRKPNSVCPSLYQILYGNFVYVKKGQIRGTLKIE